MFTFPEKIDFTPDKYKEKDDGKSRKIKRIIVIGFGILAIALNVLGASLSSGIMIRFSLFFLILDGILVFALIPEQNSMILMRVVGITLLLLILTFTGITIVPQINLEMSPPEQIINPEFFNGAVPLSCVVYEDSSMSCFPAVFEDVQELSQKFHIPCDQSVVGKGYCSYNPIEETFDCNFDIR